MNAETLATHISSGEYDKNLHSLRKAVNTRLTTIRRERTTEHFGVGDRVRFNDLCGVWHLRGQTGSVVGIRRKSKLIVALDKPVGRFARINSDGTVRSADVEVPPSIVDLVL